MERVETPEYTHTEDIYDPLLQGPYVILAKDGSYVCFRHLNTVLIDDLTKHGLLDTYMVNLKEERIKKLDKEIITLLETKNYERIKKVIDLTLHLTNISDLIDVVNKEKSLMYD